MTPSQNNESGSVFSTIEEALTPSRFSRPALIVRGVFAIALGLFLSLAPLASMAGIIMGIGIFLIFDGVVVLTSAFDFSGRIRTAGIIYGILILLTGVISLFAPLAAGWAWMIMLGAWQLIAGINILTCNYPGCNRGWSWFSGLLSLLTGILFIIWPLAGMAAFAWVTGIMLIISGTSLLLASLFNPSK